MAQMTCTDAAETEQPFKRRRVVGQSTNQFLRSWAWKREHSVRFHQPYEHVLRVPGESANHKLCIEQAPFDAQGFASTVWDSSIVMAKFLEKQAAHAAMTAPAAASGGSVCAGSTGGQRSNVMNGASADDCNGGGGVSHAEAALDTATATALRPSARIGRCRSREDDTQASATAAAARAGAAAAATGLADGRRDQQGAALSVLSVQGVRFLDLSAGCGLVGVVAALLGANVTATDLAPNLALLRRNCGANDVMYIDDAVSPLVRTLTAVCDGDTRTYVAHGRNRQAEPRFLAEVAAAGFEISEVPGEQLDALYQCTDVRVLQLQLKKLS